MDPLAIASRLSDQLLRPLKTLFVGKDEIIDVMGVALAGGENLFLHGPPGTAKSALVHELARRLDARSFDYLLTRFTEPSELFGPFDIRRLREGDLVTNTEGMLPEADFVFLDEILNANSAILNSLLLVLNERVFRRGRETRKLPALIVVGASNHLPEEEALRALFDRFLLRVHCGYLPNEELSAVIEAGWEIEKHRKTHVPSCGLTANEIRALQDALHTVDLSAVRPAYLALVSRLRAAGIDVSDRRAVKLQRVIAASALMSGRMAARVSDLWVMRCIWDREEQRELLASVVQETLSRAEPEAADHPQAYGGSAPDPEALARDLETLGKGWAESAPGVSRDQLAALAARVPWVKQPEARTALQETVEGLWEEGGGVMMPPQFEETQVAVLAVEDAAWLGRWRTRAGVEACEAEGRVWVRGPAHDSWLRLPALERYTSDEDGRLKAPGGRVPLRRLPQVRWQRLEEFLRPRPLAPSLPAQFVAPMAWSLHPSAAYREPTLLVLPFAELAAWCDGAAEARLRGLHFALADDDRACVLVLAQGAGAGPSGRAGAVLPTVPGERWCVTEHVATPAGWMLPRGIIPALVAATLQLAPEELALVHPDGSAERLPREAFVPLTRAAVRATARAKDADAGSSIGG